MVLLHVEGHSLVLAMVDAREGEEFSTALVQVSSRLLFFLMVREGKDSKGADLPCPTEFLNPKRSRDLAKHLPIEVEIVTPYMKVVQSAHLFSLFAKIVLDASWLARADTSSVHGCARLEEGPQKVKCDFTLLKKRSEALGGRLVGFLDEVE